MFTTISQMPSPKTGHINKKTLTQKQENAKNDALSTMFQLAAENKLSADDERDLARLFGA